MVQLVLHETIYLDVLVSGSVMTGGGRQAQDGQRNTTAIPHFSSQQSLITAIHLYCSDGGLIETL